MPKLNSAPQRDNGAGSQKMKHERSQALFDYWDSVRRGRPAPRRLEIEPGAIAPHLPNVFILERLDPISYRIRLAGTQLCSYCGQELRGLLFTSLWPEDERPAIESLLASVTEDASGAVAGIEGREPQGRIARFELLMLPLATIDGRFDRVIGTISAIDTPYWLGGWPVVAWTLKSSRILWPNGQPPEMVDVMAPDTVTPFPGRRRRLTVIEGGLSERDG
jgi:hypothetical protein